MVRRSPAYLTPFQSLVALGLLTLLSTMVGGVGAVWAQEAPEPRYVLALHGGAGTILRSQMTDEQDAAYRAVLEDALRAGHAVLSGGGSSVDAVVATITRLEDSDLFNAGRGAVFTHEGHVELDASIMEGAERRAGAVAGVRQVRNPILAARAVMTDSPHVLLMGEGAEAFARSQGLAMVPNAYFQTDRRRRQLERALERDADRGVLTLPPVEADEPVEQKWGTVGVVALDQSGTLAAGTSTGGMTNKRWGRVGDSPIIGAGTYADDATCAVSSTGHGEYFIRGVLAHDVSARMRFGGMSVQEAAAATIQELTDMGGTGGLIAMDGEGHVAMPFNTEGMYRGMIDAAGNVTVAIYKE